MEKVINTLKNFTGTFPQEALEQAIANQEEITPLLLAGLNELLADPVSVADEPGVMFPLFSVFLLAQFREKEAFPLIIKAFSLPADVVEYLFGDVITANLNDILFSTYNGDRALLEGLVARTDVDLWVRGAALDALGELCAVGAIDKDWLVPYLRQLIVEEPALGADQCQFHTFIQDVVVEQKLFEMQEDIKRLYDLDSIDYGYYGNYDDFVEWLEEDTPKRRVQYVEDTIRELKGWACFEPKPGSSRSKQGDQKKIGRNDPCPCGSGKKYKKCCGK